MQNIDDATERTKVINAPWSDCEKECKISRGMSTSTCMGWTPTYDKNGKQLNSDPNITTTVWTCLTCNDRWVSTTRYGETKWEAKS